MKSLNMTVKLRVLSLHLGQRCHFQLVVTLDLTVRCTLLGPCPFGSVLQFFLCGLMCAIVANILGMSSNQLGLEDEGLTAVVSVHN